MSLRLRQIEVFHAVMSTGSVTAAAEVLNISQPAVSKTLRAAAEEAGVPLFVLVKGRLVPTPEARRLHREVRAVFAEVEAIRRLAADYRAGRGDRLRVAATPALGLEVLPRAVALLSRRLRHVPAVSIATAHSGALIDDVLAGHSDVGFAFDLPDHPGLHREVLAEAHLVCALPADTRPPPPDPIPLASLSRHGLIGLERYDPLGLRLYRASAQAGVDMTCRIEVQTYHVALSLVAQGMGVAVLDPYTARLGALSAARDGGAGTSPVVVRRLTPALPFAVHAVTAATQRPSRLVHRLIAAFRAVLEQVAPTAAP